MFSRSCSLSVRCLLTQTLMTLWFLRLPTCTSPTGPSMKLLHGAGHRSMPWVDMVVRIFCRNETHLYESCIFFLKCFGWGRMDVGTLEGTLWGGIVRKDILCYAECFLFETPFTNVVIVVKLLQSMFCIEHFSYAEFKYLIHLFILDCPRKYMKAQRGRRTLFFISVVWSVDN